MTLAPKTESRNYLSSARRTILDHPLLNEDVIGKFFRAHVLAKEDEFRCFPALIPPAIKLAVDPIPNEVKEGECCEDLPGPGDDSLALLGNDVWLHVFSKELIVPAPPFDGPAPT